MINRAYKIIEIIMSSQIHASQGVKEDEKHNL